MAEKDGSFTVNVSPPHIVDSGASVMNTQDLADRLEQFYTGTHITKAAETLRQQADTIAILQQQRDAYKEAHDALLELNLSKQFNVSE